MESSSAAPRRFRFRDHSIPESQNSMHSSVPSSDVSAVSQPGSDGEIEPDIESMTARGIKHLCDELLELKEAANEDLQKHIFANYSSFLSILEEVKGVESELVQLENHLESHQRLLRDLVDRMYPQICSISSNLEDNIDVDEPSPPSEFEAHINDVSEKLDFFMSENRIDEALELLESADAHCQGIRSEDYFYCEIDSYDTLIYEKKSMVKERLIQIAEHNRTVGPELQNALAGLCRLGETHLAIHILLKHYHMRILNGSNNLEWSKSSSDEIYIRELARFVFSMISHAARGFVKLCGKDSPHTTELLMWACEETNSFLTCFEEHVKCISANSGGLSSAIKAVKFAVMYCSLLEKQGLVLRPYLVRNLCPCMEGVLNAHISHFKKVIGIFVASDHWVLDKYLVSGVFGGGSLTLAAGELPEYFPLTISGRKFLTLLQALVEDISPLVSLQMGSSVINGLTNLFTEYVVILERALTDESKGKEEVSPGIKVAETVRQQVSILANMSTLVKFLSFMVENIYSSNCHTEKNSILDQQQELDGFLLFIGESCNKLRNVFCQKLVMRVSSTYHTHELFSDIHNNDYRFDDDTIHSTVPSGIFQVLFLELRKIERLDEENVFEIDWLMGLLRELMEFMFIWVSRNKEMYTTTEENMSLQTEEEDNNQFILDVLFLVEIGMHGGYFSNDPLLLLTLMKSTFNSAGLDPFKDEENDGWTIDAANKTIQKLLEIEKTSMQPKEHVINTEEELHEIQSNQSTYLSEDDISVSSENNKDELLEVDISAETASLDEASIIPQEGSSLLKRNYDEIKALNLKENSIIAESGKGADAEHYELAPTSPIGDEIGKNTEGSESKSDE